MQGGHSAGNEPIFRFKRGLLGYLGCFCVGPTEGGNLQNLDNRFGAKKHKRLALRMDLPVTPIVGA